MVAARPHRARPAGVGGGALLTGAAVRTTGTLLAGSVAASGRVRRLRKAALARGRLSTLVVIATRIAP